MKLLNPAHVDPITTWVNNNKANVQAWLAAAPQKDMREISFDYVRANAAGMAGKSDGELAEICKACGITVVA